MRRADMSDCLYARTITSPEDEVAYANEILYESWKYLDCELTFSRRSRLFGLDSTDTKSITISDIAILETAGNDFALFLESEGEEDVMLYTSLESARVAWDILCIKRMDIDIQRYSD